MNLIYIDDSGNTGKKLDEAQQPLFLLGGFSINENDWKNVDKSFSKIKESYGLFDTEVHAIDIINGKKGTPYRSWDYQKKLDFFAEILSLVKSYNLKIIYFAVKKDNFKSYFQSKFGKDFEQQFSLSPYLLAFSYILQISDSLLKTSNENGMLILDNQDEWKKPATKTFNILRSVADEPEVKIENLIDRCFFVDSSESNMIQLADIISYTLKRYLECEIKTIPETKQEERKKLYAIIQNNIYKPNFDYGKHKILQWLEDNVGNQA